MKHKDTYKVYTKLKKNKQDTFYNEHTAEIILFESAKNSLYSQIIDMRKEVERAEKVKICIEWLQEHSKQLAQSKNQDLEL